MSLASSPGSVSGGCGVSATAAVFARAAGLRLTGAASPLALAGRGCAGLRGPGLLLEDRVVTFLLLIGGCGLSRSAAVGESEGAGAARPHLGGCLRIA